MLNIDRQSSKPAYAQVVDEFSHLILSGSLGADEQIPSVRSLALEVGINPNTIQKAYGILEQAGLTYAVAGVGRFVSPAARELIKQSRHNSLGSLKQQLGDLALAQVDKQLVLDAVEEAYAHNATTGEKWIPGQARNDEVGDYPRQARTISGESLDEVRSLTRPTGSNKEGSQQ
jgi:GntR family transcriptional regulator